MGNNCGLLLPHNYGSRHFAPILSRAKHTKYYRREYTANVVAAKMTFEAKVLEVQDHALIVEPLEGTQERGFAESISIDTDDLAELNTVKYVAFFIILRKPAN